MACDIRLKPRQTVSERKAEVKKAIIQLDKLIASGQVNMRVGPQGAVVFKGWSDVERDGVTDACAYRMLMVSGSALSKAKMAQAGQVSRQVIGQGVHSHDGGKTWHNGH